MERFFHSFLVGEGFPFTPVARGHSWLIPEQRLTRAKQGGATLLEFVANFEEIAQG